MRRVFVVGFACLLNAVLWVPFAKLRFFKITLKNYSNETAQYQPIRCRRASQFL